MNFSIFYPIKPFKITQAFGRPDPVYTGLGLKGHNGLDLLAYHGQPIYATHDGTAYYEIDGNQGHGVVLRSDVTYDYQGEQVYMKTIYWHMCDSTKEPQFKSPVEAAGVLKVKVGDLLGYADNTGLSTGDHLHFGLKPQGKDESNGAWYNVEQNNGYLGAIDPEPFFNGKYVDGNTKFTFMKDLGLYSVSNDVYQLQKRLVEENCGNFIPTGFFGSKTQAAVVAFQVKYGVKPVTGFCGPLTRGVLNQ